jgi:HemX protein
MLHIRIFYDLLTVLYAPSMVLFYVDAVAPKRNVNRLAVFLLFCVFLCETVILLSRLHALGHMPVYSRFDALLLISWLILLIALVVDAFFRVDLFLFFANVPGFAIVLFDSFAGQAGLPYAAHERDLLLFHIGLAILAYVLFSISFVLSVMYLLQETILRKKLWNTWFLRLPSLERLDRFALRSVMVGLPLLILSGILGTIWGSLVWHEFLLFDPKPIGTLVLWLMYGLYLGIRMKSGWGGTSLAWYNLFCFGGVIVNFWVIGDFSVFHHGV